MPDNVQRPLAASPSFGAQASGYADRLARLRERSLAQRSLTQRVFELIHAADAGHFDRWARSNRGLHHPREAETS